MNHVPVMILLELVTGRHAAVDSNDSIQTVQLVRHAGGEDGGIGPDDGSWEVVVFLGIRDLLEAHANFIEGSALAERMGGRNNTRH